MTDLNELLERVKKATGPDRELDGLIEVEARRQEAYAVGLDDSQRAYWQTNAAGTVFEGGTIYAAPLFTDSTDVALALVERALPGIWWVLAKGRMTSAEPLYACELLFGHDQQIAIADGATLPLAILAALLSALISKEAQS